MIDRIQQNQGGTLNAYWERDGVAFDPGSTTVTVTGDDGTVYVNAQTATGSGSGGRTYVISPSVATTLDRLTAVWTASDGSTLTTIAEVVGGYYFSVAFARGRTPLQDATTYTVQNILDYRTLAEQSIEDITGTAFVRRFSKEQARIVGNGYLELPRRNITKVRAMYTTDDSGQVAVQSLSGLRIMNGSLIWFPSYLNFWSMPITIAYEHGYSTCPPRVSRAGFELARRWLIESPWDERTTGFRTRDGGEMTILTGSHSAVFDIPEVVALADAYGFPLIA